jgi:hypothetical protein
VLAPRGMSAGDNVSPREPEHIRGLVRGV